MARANILLGLSNCQINKDENGQAAADDNDVLLQVAGGVKGTIIKTDDPGNGPGLWELGKVINAGVALDGTRYVEVKIDGVIVKLAVVV